MTPKRWWWRLSGIGLLLLTACVGTSAPPTATSLPSKELPAAITVDSNGVPSHVKIGIVVFLSGGAAAPFGLPAKNGAEAMIESINAGEAPAPYNTPGIGGVPILPVFIDEAGGAEQQVAEIKRLFAEENVELVIGYISSGDCLAIAPVVETLQRLVVAFDCGTSRLFEEQPYTYLFRTNAHQAIDSIAGARYLLEQFPEVQTVAGINQNYSWGQDSWAHFIATLRQLKPDIQVVGEQFPKLNAESYSAELAALETGQPQIVHTSFWGADLSNLLNQAASQKLLTRSTLLLSVGEYALPELGAQIPKGSIIGAHGPHGIMAPANDLNVWLTSIYRLRFNARPTYPVYHMAQALLGVKYAYETARAQPAAPWPTPAQVAAAFAYASFPSPSGVISMAIGNGHQAIEPATYGRAGDYNTPLGEVTITHVREYPAACVNPPNGTTTEAWIRAGFPGAQCP